MIFVCISGHFPWLKKALIYLQSSRVTSDMKYLVDTAFAMIEERRHQNTEWKVTLKGLNLRLFLVSDT